VEVTGAGVSFAAADQLDEDCLKNLDFFQGKLRDTCSRFFSAGLRAGSFSPGF
jgi:hypothetical protein